ncbi:S-methylmethionine permease mmp1 [Branchiostoma belcheri]|nr:S-methylmethionine permease mmp1 [Branchiostoma belcheri]
MNFIAQQFVGSCGVAADCSTRNQEIPGSSPDMPPILCFLSRRPRCGVSDAEDGRTSHVRWGRTDLTYKISYYTADLTREEVDIAIADAFRLWESVSALRFTRVFGHADIDVSFVYGDHFGDERPFDGPSTPSGGGSLAHAFPPDSGSDFAGDVHFDDSEDWTMDKREGINLYQMAVHEIGHSLGLSHSHQHTSVMYPYYLGLRRHFRLHRDDIRDIQRLYGPPRTETVDSKCGALRSGFHLRPPVGVHASVLPVPATGRARPPARFPGIHETPGMPRICTAATHIDTIARMGTETWVFKNRYFWRGPDGKNGPYVISDYWRGLSDHTNHIDAIYQRETDQKVVIFQGRHYYVFHVNKLESGPHRIVDLGLPNYVDAVLPWEGHTYFFRFLLWLMAHRAASFHLLLSASTVSASSKGMFALLRSSWKVLRQGRRYWLYDEKERRLDSRTPKPIRRIRYWLYDEKERRLDSRTPKPIRRMWKGLPWDGVDAAIRHDDGALYFFNGDQVYRLDERELEVMQGYPRVAATDYFRCPPPVTRDHRPQFRFPSP